MNLDIYFPTPEDIEGWVTKETQKPPPSYFTNESDWINHLFKVRFLILQRASERVDNVTVIIDDKKRAISLCFELEKMGYMVNLKEVNKTHYHLKISWRESEEEDEIEEDSDNI